MILPLAATPVHHTPENAQASGPDTSPPSENSPLTSGLGGALGGAVTGLVPCAPLTGFGPWAFGGCVAAFAVAGATYARVNDTTFHDGATAAVNGVACSAATLLAGTTAGISLGVPALGFGVGAIGSWYAGIQCATQSREGHSPVGEFWHALKNASF